MEDSRGVILNLLTPVPVAPFSPSLGASAGCPLLAAAQPVWELEDNPCRAPGALARREDGQHGFVLSRTCASLAEPGLQRGQSNSRGLWGMMALNPIAAQEHFEALWNWWRAENLCDGKTSRWWCFVSLSRWVMGCVTDLGSNTGFVTEQPEMGNQAWFLYLLAAFLKVSCLAAPGLTS